MAPPQRPALVNRILVSILLLPVGLFLVWIGGLPFILLAALLLGLAAYEFYRLFRAGGLRPAGVFVVGGTLLLVTGRALNGFESAPWMICLIILASMAYHLVEYERGCTQAGTDFAVTVAGALYLGWMGSYLVSLRDLQAGFWWLALVLSAVWIADAAAYLAGTRFGRHKMSPRLSPKKTWEGYLGGVLASLAGTALLAQGFLLLAGPGAGITPWRGALLGLVLSGITPLGDLGESMIKRQAGAKDSGKLFPGHGGAFDRMDTWLWAGAIGYYLITGLFLN